MAQYCRKTGKVKHKSEGAALAHLRALIRQVEEYLGHPYLCPSCRGWHVGRLRTSNPYLVEKWLAFRNCHR